MKTLRLTTLLALLASVTLLATTATDNFTGNDTDPIGANWTCTLNGMEILSNKAVVDVGGSYNFCYRSAEAFDATHSSQAVLALAAGAGDHWLTVRHQSGGDHYGLMCHATLGLRLYSYISSSFGLIEDLSTACTDGHTYKLGINGTTFTVTDNATPVTVTQGSGGALSGGKPGIGGAVALTSWDDWVGDGVSAGGGSTPCTMMLLGVGKCEDVVWQAFQR